MRANVNEVITHKSLGRALIIKVDGDKVYLASLPGFKANFEDRMEICYNIYKHNLSDGTMKFISDLGSYRDYEFPEEKSSYIASITVKLLARLLDESVDSKQIFQGLNDEGLALEGLKLTRNYLGRWRFYLQDQERPVSELLDMVNRLWLYGDITRED